MQTGWGGQCRRCSDNPGVISKRFFSLSTPAVQLALGFGLGLALAGPVAAGEEGAKAPSAEEETLPAREVMRWEPPLAATTAQPVRLPPTRPATRPWRLCVLFPHIKDAYWLGVNYGMAEQARKLGLAVQFFEAGGYPNLATQREQARACGADPRVDALIVGTVSFDGLSPLLAQIARRIPVLATVNDIAPPGITAKVGVDWVDMGRATGRRLVEEVGPGTAPVPIAWFPGPRGAGWVPFVDRGFREAIAGSRIEIRHTAWGDTGKAVQRNLVQRSLDAHPQLRYLVGNAPMAEAAVSVLRERGLQERVDIVSTYFTPDVYRGILRGRVLAAPTDAPVLQGRLSIDQAVDLLEGRPVARHVGPVIRIVDRDRLADTDIDDSLPPSSFAPLFRVEPPR